MRSRTATCSCGQLRIEVRGEPLGVGVCHCLACQRRTGSVFAAPYTVTGAAIRACRPDWIEGQASACAGVGPEKACSNQRATAGWKEDKGLTRLVDSAGKPSIKAFPASNSTPRERPALGG